MPTQSIAGLSNHQRRVNETYSRLVAKNIRGIDLGTTKPGQVAHANQVIWKPNKGNFMLALFVISQATLKNGTVAAARFQLKAGTPDIVAAVAPSVVVGGATQHTIVPSLPFSYDNPITLTTILSTGVDGTGAYAGSSGLLINLTIVAVRLADIMGN